MGNKNRVLFLLRHLLDTTDEDHPLTNAQIQEILKKNGYPAEMRTVRDDIRMLNDMGFDIVETYPVAGKAANYYYGERNFETQELQVLIDAIESAQFIPFRKSRELAEKLVKQACFSDRELLTPRVFISEKIKSTNEQIYYIMQNVTEAIRNKRQIAFRYFNYNLKKERIYRHNGELYRVSPYATIWANDRYYLLAWSDKRNTVIAFRMDRMDLPAILNEPARPEPDDFNLQNYAGKITMMYSGHDALVTLRCEHDMIDQVIDKFGPDVPIENITENTFDAIVQVSVSGTFFAWVFQYLGKITIEKPLYVREEYFDAMRQQLGEE